MPLSKVDAPPKGVEQQARAAKLTRDVNSMQTQPPVQLPHKERAFSNNFPANYIPRDSYDDAFAMKQRNTANNPFVGGETETVMRITGDDVEYQKRKAQVANNLRYQAWLINNIDMTDPKQGTLTSSRSARRQGVKGKIKKPTRALAASIKRQNKTKTTPLTVARPRGRVLKGIY